MARVFASASTQYGSVASTPITGVPCTLSCWFRPDNITATEVLFGFGDLGIGTWTGFYLAVDGATTDSVQAVSAVANTFRIATTTTDYTAGAWHQAGGIFATTTSRAAYLNGGGKGTDANSSNPTGLTGTRFAVGLTNLLPALFNGQLAEVAAWDVALTDAEMAILGLGVCPLLVRPASLVMYRPLVGYSSPEIDLIGGVNLTLTNSPTVGAHPRVIYPNRPQLIIPAAAAPPAGNRRRRFFMGAAA